MIEDTSVPNIHSIFIEMARIWHKVVFKGKWLSFQANTKLEMNIIILNYKHIWNMLTKVIISLLECRLEWIYFATSVFYFVTSKLSPCNPIALHIIIQRIGFLIHKQVYPVQCTVHKSKQLDHAFCSSWIVMHP